MPVSAIGDDADRAAVIELDSYRRSNVESPRG
jgi:hypothetical protein